MGKLLQSVVAAARERIKERPGEKESILRGAGHAVANGYEALAKQAGGEADEEKIKELVRQTMHQVVTESDDMESDAAALDVGAMDETEEGEDATRKLEDAE